MSTESSSNKEELIPVLIDKRLEEWNINLKKK